MKKIMTCALLISSSLLFCGCAKKESWDYVTKYDEVSNTLILDFSDFYKKVNNPKIELEPNNFKNYRVMIPSTYESKLVSNYLIIGHNEDGVYDYEQKNSIPNLSLSFQANKSEEVNITFKDFIADSSTDSNCMLDLTGIQNATINAIGNNYLMFNGVGTAIKGNFVRISGSEETAQTFNCYAQNKMGEASDCCDVETLNLDNVDVTFKGANANMVNYYYNPDLSIDIEQGSNNYPSYTPEQFATPNHGGTALKALSINVEMGTLNLFGGDGDRGYDAKSLTNRDGSKGGNGGDSGYCIAFKSNKPAVYGYDMIYLNPGKGGNGGNGLDGKQGAQGYDGRDAGFAHGSEGGGQGAKGEDGGDGGKGGDSLILYNDVISNYINIFHNLGGKGGKGGNGGKGGKGGQGGDSYGLIGAAPGGSGGEGGKGGEPGANGTNSDGTVDTNLNDHGVKGDHGEQGDHGYNWYK